MTSPWQFNEINNRPRNSPRHDHDPHSPIPDTQRSSAHHLRRPTVSQRRPLEGIHSLRPRRHSCRSACARPGSHMGSRITEPTAADIERGNMSKQWHSACSKCSARWFSPEPTAECPRCRGQPLPAELRTVPWMKQRNETDETQPTNLKSEKHPE